MLTVFGRATSSNVQLVMWAIAELGLEYERHDLGHIHGGLDRPDYLAMNPNGLVPTLKDGDTVVWESCAILRYIAAQFGDDSFWPSNPARRAEIDKWAEWGKINFALAFTAPIFWLRVRTAAKDRDEAAMMRAIAQFERQIDILEGQIADKDFVCGNVLTAADIVIGHVLYRWFDIDVPRKPRPVLERYYHNLTTRPAYREHVMIDYSVLAVDGA